VTRSPEIADGGGKSYDSRILAGRSARTSTHDWWAGTARRIRRRTTINRKTSTYWNRIVKGAHGGDESESNRHSGGRAAAVETPTRDRKCKRSAAGGNGLYLPSSFKRRDVSSVR